MNMNNDKENNRKAKHNSSQDRNTKSPELGTYDSCSRSVRCSQRDETMKTKSNTEKTCKPEKPFDFKKNPEQIVNKDSVIPIYTAPKEFHDISKRFECKYKRLGNEKTDMPCTCENCALMGVLRDSQKIPFADEDIRRTRKRRKQERRGTEEADRDERKKKSKEDHTHCRHYKQLVHRINDLEERLQIQEETTIPKIEFKRIITGLLAYLRAYKNHDKTFICTQCRYAKDVEHSIEKPSSSKPPSNTEERSGSSRNHKRSHCDKKTSSVITNNNFWKWGEEILKPGIDIKNKVLLLVEDTLKKIPRGIYEPDAQYNTFIADTSNEAPLNAMTVEDTKSPISIKGNVHYSDTSLKISYFNPDPWEVSDSSLKPATSDVNLSRKSKSLENIYVEKFKKIVDHSSQEYRQKLWDTIWKQCLIYGYGKSHTATIYFPHRNGEDRIIVEFTVEELENLLIGKKTGTM